ncbi:MAG: lipopolysaccharide heptosyltransferase I [Hyphomicrobiaceae bacterium]
MQVLIVKLSSLGDVVHAMPVVHDIRQAYPDALIDWVVEPAFAPLVREVDGIHEVIECALRRWRRAWWRGAIRAEWRDFRAKLSGVRYDAVLDLQGLTKSAMIAKLANGRSYGLANRTEGSSFESPARWLVDHAIRIEPRTHVLDRSRALAALAIGYQVDGSPQFGLRQIAPPMSHSPTVVFAHGSSRADKLWPEASWIELGTRLSRQGWRIALPHTGDAERDRAQRIAAAVGACTDLWPEMPLDALILRMSRTQGAIGVDSGLSHIAVALGLPHVQIYNFPTAWRTGPLWAHGHRQQVSVQARPTPSLDAVWEGWTGALSHETVP